MLRTVLNRELLMPLLYFSQTSCFSDLELSYDMARVRMLQMLW